MATSKRQTILQAIETTLQGITVAGGYNNDIGASQVSLKFRSYDDPATTEFPQLIIVSGDSLYTAIAPDRYTSGRSQQTLDGWQIEVLGYVHVETDTADEGLITQALEDLVQDVLKAIFANEDLGLSYVCHTGLRAILPYMDFENNIGVVHIILEVKYDFKRTTP
jgi:hypothetical protein